MLRGHKLYPLIVYSPLLLSYADKQSQLLSVNAMTAPQTGAAVSTFARYVIRFYLTAKNLIMG